MGSEAVSRYMWGAAGNKCQHAAGEQGCSLHPQLGQVTSV